MAPEIGSRVKFEDLSVSEKADFIIKERTPSPDQVIFTPTIEFLDAEGELTREERGRVVAMGDRTAMSYRKLMEKVVSDRALPQNTSPDEGVDKTASFYQQYALAARSSDEIAHTSILEQLNPGPDVYGGDTPIIMEGISILSGLRDVCSQRYAAFEALSSRGAIFPEGYWRIPKELAETSAGPELEAINREIYRVYTDLTRKGLEEYLRVTPKKEKEKSWEYRWRVLSLALDDARQVTNGTFLNHLAYHPNSALALRETVASLAANPLPETQDIANKLRQMARAGLPTIMQHTEASPYQQSLYEIRENLSYGWRRPKEKEVSESMFVSGSITPDAERIFLSAFWAGQRGVSYEAAYEQISTLTPQEILDNISIIFEDIGRHDRPPKELELVKIHANYYLPLGAIYELIRQGPMTHIVSNFGIRNGHNMPEIYRQLELEAEYESAISLNERAFDLVSDIGPGYSSVFGPYCTARAHMQPVTISMDGYEAFHFLRIRASNEAHPDIRKPAYETLDFLKGKSSIFRYI